MKKTYVRICPKCKSKNIETNMTAVTIGMGTFNNEYKCKNCGYEGMFFPEVEKSNLKRLKK